MIHTVLPAPEGFWSGGIPLVTNPGCCSLSCGCCRCFWSSLRPTGSLHSDHRSDRRGNCWQVLAFEHIPAQGRRRNFHQASKLLDCPNRCPYRTPHSAGYGFLIFLEIKVDQFYLRGLTTGIVGFREFCSGSWSSRTTLSNDLFTWIRSL